MTEYWHSEEDEISKDSIKEKQKTHKKGEVDMRQGGWKSKK